MFLLLNKLIKSCVIGMCKPHDPPSPLYSLSVPESSDRCNLAFMNHLLPCWCRLLLGLITLAQYHINEIT